MKPLSSNHVSTARRHAVSSVQASCVAVLMSAAIATAIVDLLSLAFSVRFSAVVRAEKCDAWGNAAQASASAVVQIVRAYAGGQAQLA